MAATEDSFAAGSPAAVRLPRSPPLKVLAKQLRRDAEGGPGAGRLSRAAAGRGPLELAAVWMQGTVVAARLDCGTERGLLGARPGVGAAWAALPRPRQVCHGNGGGACLQPPAVPPGREADGSVR
jgi:hypothetical protein